MNRASDAKATLERFFLDLTNRSLGQLGIGGRREAEYLAAMLADFGTCRPWLPTRGIEAREFLMMADLMLERIAREERESQLAEGVFRKHVGDFSLFMTGIFRRFIERHGLLDSYFATGSRQYSRLSRMGPEGRYDPAVFDELSRGFERYSGAIDYMRKCFFAHPPGENPFADFIEQVKRRAIISPN